MPRFAERPEPAGRRAGRLALLCLLAPLLAAACNSGGGGGGTPTEPPPAGIDPRLAEVIEALFLGTGPRAAGGCITPGVWTGYRAASSVRVVVAASVSGGGRDPLVAAVADLDAATGSWMGLTPVFSSRANPDPGRMEIVSVDLDDDTVASFCGTLEGCFRPFLTELPFLDSGKAYQRRSPIEGRLHAHELGHGIGLCHLARGAEPESVMAQPIGDGPSAFSAVELTAIGAVFSSGLAPGATRPDFVAAGLLP